MKGCQKAKLFVLLMISTLVGCGGLPPVVSMNVKLADYQITVAEKFPTASEKVAVIDIPNTYFGVSSNKRGSLGVGLLLGPIGVAANIAYVQSETQKLADKVPALFDINLSQIVAGQGNYPLGNPSSSARQILLVPAGRIFFATDDDYTVQCQLHARVIDAGKETSAASYSLLQAVKFSGQSAETKKQVAGELQKCFADAVVLMKAHLSDGLMTNGYEMKVKDPNIGSITINARLADEWLDRRVISRFYAMLLEYSRDAVIEIKKLPPQ